MADEMGFGISGVESLFGLRVETAPEFSEWVGPNEALLVPPDVLDLMKLAVAAKPMRERGIISQELEFSVRNAAAEALTKALAEKRACKIINLKNDVGDISYEQTIQHNHDG